MIPLPDPTKKDIEKFFLQVLKSKHKNGCWWWDGCKDECGYGYFFYQGRTIRAHRFLLHGKIPKGMLCCHKCDNPDCVNPDHIFFGTDLDNNRDMIRKGREKNSRKGIENGTHKLTEEDVYQIRYDPQFYDMRLKEIANIFNTTKSVISSIRTRRTWKHLK